MDIDFNFLNNLVSSMVLKEECSLCGRVFPYYKLRKCARCGKLFCKDCMIEDVTLPLPSHQRMVCLKCARRAVSPKKPAGNKYTAFTNYLVKLGRYTDYASIKFSKIEGIIGDSLPETAYTSAEWWKNTENTLQGHAWLLAGWQVEQVNLEERKVVFKKIKTLERKKHRRKSSSLKKPFTPVPVRKVKPRKPSKTKISKIIARMHNIQRRKASGYLRGRFKSKPAHEKRLFKPEAKPRES